MSVLDNIIPQVRELGAYTLKATEARVKLNQNESPWDFDAETKERILARCRAADWNRYPDFHPADVLEGLGALHGVCGRHVLIGNGSNELIQATMSAIVGKGTPLAFPEPTFTLYRMMVAANQGESIAVPLADDLTYDQTPWLELAAEGRAHLLLCSPNNPTGSTVRAEFVEELLATTERLVIVDEAYAQFGPHDIARMVADHDNLIVLRTFSKAVGLAAVRFGYALAHPELAEQIHKVKLPYNVGVFGLEVARELIAHPKLLEGACEALAAERDRVRETISELEGVEVLSRWANFVLFRARDHRRLFNALFDQGILIRDVSHYPKLEGCLRVSIGTPRENDEFIAASTAFYDKLDESTP